MVSGTLRMFRVVSTSSVNALEVLLVLASDSDTVKVKMPLPAGSMVPLSTPEAESESPGGRLPADTDQVSGDFPPVAAKVKVYGCPGRPAGSGVAEVIAGRLKTEMPSPRVAN